MNWDERYNTSSYIYGTEPNAFVAESAELLPPGRILCLAEGEGRNAVYLASLGFGVTAVDASAIGMQKAQLLAEQKSVAIRTVVADLAAFPIGTEEWNGIISCYCHLPSSLRSGLHRKAVDGLRPGGILVLEGFAKEQPAYGTGGPQDGDMLFSLEELKQELSGLEFVTAIARERVVHEGTGHTGLAAVVQLVGRKPSRPERNEYDL